MKKLLISILCLCGLAAGAATTTITALPEKVTIEATDVFPIVDVPGGNINKKVKWSTLYGYVQPLDADLTALAGIGTALTNGLATTAYVDNWGWADTNTVLWLAPRTDGVTGTGTEADPFDASNATKFDAIMWQHLKTGGTSNKTFMLKPGTYYTAGQGDYGATYGWYANTNSLNIAIVGAGADTTRIVMTNGSAQTGSYAGFVIDSGAQNWLLRGFTIDMGTLMSVSGADGRIAAVYFKGGTNIVMKDLVGINTEGGTTANTIFQVAFNYDSAGNKGRNVLIDNVQVRNVTSGKKNGIGSTADFTKVVNCYVDMTGAGTGNIGIGLGGDGSIYANNFVTNTFEGMSTDTGVFKDVIIANNYVQASSAAINLAPAASQSVSNVLILNNTLNGAAYGVILQHTGDGVVHDVAILNNQFPIVSSPYAVSVNPATNVVILNNVFAEGNSLSSSGQNVTAHNYDYGGTLVPGIANTVKVTAEAYDASGWDNDLTVPTKNDTRDKFEAVALTITNITAGAGLATSHSGQAQKLWVTNVALAQLGITGTPDGTKYLRDDYTWQAVAAGTGSSNITDNAYVATIRNATISTNLIVNGTATFGSAGTAGVLLLGDSDGSANGGLKAAPTTTSDTILQLPAAPAAGFVTATVDSTNWVLTATDSPAAAATLAAATFKGGTVDVGTVLATNILRVVGAASPPAVTAFGQFTFDTDIMGDGHGTWVGNDGKAAATNVIFVTLPTTGWAAMTDGQVLKANKTGGYFYPADDNNSGSATAWSAIADPDADATIQFAGYEQTITSTLDEAAHTMLTLSNTDADAANATTMLKLSHNDGAASQVTYLSMIGDADGTPSTDFTFNQSTGFTSLLPINPPAEAYGAGWNTDTGAPQKDAVYDEMELRAPKANAVFTGTHEVASIKVTGILTNNNLATDRVLLSSDTATITNAANVTAAMLDTVKTGISGVYREIWVPASAMNPSATAGAAFSTNAWATTTDGQTIETYDFDADAKESVQFTLTLPTAWDGADPKIKFVWKPVVDVDATETNTWGAVGGSINDNEDGGNTLGTEATVNDVALQSTNKVHISAAMTVDIGGTPSAGHFIWFKVFRDATNGYDVMENDARLIGVHIQYKETETEPSTW